MFEEAEAVRKRSAGILLYRRAAQGIEVFLVHPGGPFWAKKDEGAWSIPKGEPDAGEEPARAALREFREETGVTLTGAPAPLGLFRQASGKLVFAFALEGDADAARIVSNRCEVEWPPRSGRRLDIPEVDRTAWFSLDEASRRLVAGQRPMLAALVDYLSGRR